MIESKCPACGAAAAFSTSIALFAVCPFCRSLVMRKDMDLEALGKVAQLQPDGTPLQVGARGKYKGAPFTVVGRVQMRMPVGFWNEWALMFEDGRQGWLGEAQGTYAVSFYVKSDAPADHAALAEGSKVDLAGETFTVRDASEARYESAEGELPFRPPLGLTETVPSVDLVAPGGRFATIDYSEKPPLVFVGEYQEFDALEFTNLRKIEGWE
ncbi:MAG: DUF4178 domain-containing protein [Elusimicrobia bacterium]|nr:DUF4178 domain-containing protein [Elusimicrobiota bacterium]